MQRLSRLEEVEKNNIETTKRRFFAEILNSVRELQLQIQASLKRRKQRNDGIQVLFLLSFISYCKRCNQGFASVCLEVTTDLFIYITANINIVILHYSLCLDFYFNSTLLNSLFIIYVINLNCNTTLTYHEHVMRD